MPKDSRNPRNPPRPVQHTPLIADKLIAMTDQAPHPAPDSGAAPSATLKQKVLVYSTLAVSLLLAIGLTTAIGIRWMNQRTPSSIVIFHANAGLIDAVIQISGDNEMHRAPVKIQQNADFATPIFLEPGAYSFTVKKAESIVYQDQMYVAEGCRYDVDLKHSPTP